MTLARLNSLLSTGASLDDVAGEQPASSTISGKTPDDNRIIREDLSALGRETDRALACATSSAGEGLGVGLSAPLRDDAPDKTGREGRLALKTVNNASGVTASMSRIRQSALTCGLW